MSPATRVGQQAVMDSSAEAGGAVTVAGQCETGGAVVSQQGQAGAVSDSLYQTGGAVSSKLSQAGGAVSDSLCRAGGLRLLTWNINGIRSLGDFGAVLGGLEADIICVQETKVTRDMLTEAVALIPGFSSYFSFSRRRTGYSGVATYCRSSATPSQSEEGLSGSLESPGDGVGGSQDLATEFPPDVRRELDMEGRTVITRHLVKGGSPLVVINVYCPRADPEREDRKRYKLHFYRALAVRAAALRAAGDRVVIVGDVNTSHREVDHCEPYEGFRDRADRRFLEQFILTPEEEEEEEEMNEEQKEKSEEEEREVDEWVTVSVAVPAKQFLDSFRLLHPDTREAFTCWNTEKNCRATNYGTRIDYILSSVDLRNHLLSCDILASVMGSDHCPVVAHYELQLDPPSKPPRGATLHFQEFSGRQALLSRYFSKGEAPGKRKAEVEESAPLVEVKKGRKEKKTITSFFAPKKSVKDDNVEDKTVNDNNADAPARPAKSSVHCLSSSEDESDMLSSIPDQDVPPSPHKSQPNAAPLVAAKNVPVKNLAAKSAWGSMFKPVAAAPPCPGHQEPCVRRKVSKKGPNTGREFWCCGRGEGKAGDPLARCDFFKWIK